MRLRFWSGFAVVAVVAIGSIALALVVHDRESDSFERAQRSEATRARPRDRRSGAHRWRRRCGAVRGEGIGPGLSADFRCRDAVHERWRGRARRRAELTHPVRAGA
jgi:hypothetical protein